MKQSRALLLIVVVVVIVFLLWWGSWRLILSSSEFANWPERGAFGDMFGAVNTLFAGLAFGGLVVAIYLQTIELSLQRRELEETRFELRGQREQLTDQSNTIKQQRFEGTFFQLLQFHHDISHSLEIVFEDEMVRGRTCFKKLCEELCERLRKESTPGEILEQYSQINESYLKFYKLYRYGLLGYFHNLHNILIFVDQSDISNMEFYIGLLKALLSNAELVLIFYHCMSESGRLLLRPLVESHQLLSDLPAESICIPQHFDMFRSMRSIIVQINQT